MHPAQDETQSVLLEGQIVEVFERGGERRARIVVRLPAVLEVPAGSMADLRLGDQVVVDGSITLGAVRARADDDLVARGV